MNPTHAADDTSDPELPILHIRGGSIVPLGPTVQFSDEKPLNPLTLVVCPDEHGHAQGQLYEDAGDGYGYQEGFFRLTTFEANTDQGHITVHPDKPFGRMHASDREVEVIVLLDGGRTLRGSGREGKAITISIR